MFSNELVKMLCFFSSSVCKPSEKVPEHFFCLKKVACRLKPTPKTQEERKERASSLFTNGLTQTWQPFKKFTLSFSLQKYIYLNLSWDLFVCFLYFPLFCHPFPAFFFFTASRLIILSSYSLFTDHFHPAFSFFLPFACPSLLFHSACLFNFFILDTYLSLQKIAD